MALLIKKVTGFAIDAICMNTETYETIEVRFADKSIEFHHKPLEDQQWETIKDSLTLICVLPNNVITTTNSGHRRISFKSELPCSLDVSSSEATEYTMVSLFNAIM